MPLALLKRLLHATAEWNAMRDALSNLVLAGVTNERGRLMDRHSIARTLGMPVAPAPDWRYSVGVTFDDVVSLYPSYPAKIA
jgi:hypothetical protein